MSKTYVITVDTDNPYERDMGHTNGTLKLYPIKELSGMTLEGCDLEELKSAEDYFYEHHAQIVEFAYQRGWDDAYKNIYKMFAPVIENGGVSIGQ